MKFSNVLSITVTTVLVFFFSTEISQFYTRNFVHHLITTQ